MKNVCVIGGGAAGLMAAYAAAKNGNRVILFEKNEKLGKKIYITGKGRCNFTNDCSLEEFFQNIVNGEKFLKSALYAFSPQNAMEFFENHGLTIKTERGNRVFPASDHASDVTKTLEKACKSVGVDVRLNEKVLYFKHIMPDIIPMSGIDSSTSQDIIPTSGILLLKTEKGEYFCDNIIVATGGVSYPSTGSTGDGYSFAKTIGHTVTPLYSGLCGLNLSNDGLADLQGLALKNVQITAKQGSKTVFNDFGELLFTHFGVSGPIVLSMSSKINRLPVQNLSVTLDLKPALDENTLDKRILRDFETFNNKQIGNALNALLPQKLIPFVLKYCNIPLQKNVSIITKEERTRLCKTMKALPLYVESLRGFNEAIITSGGIALSEINPKTMESKKMAGVKFCGEVLDVDAFTGGFNMQIAFATGFAAGNTIE